MHATSIPAGATAGIASAPASQRLTSLDAYRGLVMFLMMAEVLRLAEVASRVPGSGFWSFLAFHQTHAPWAGCSLHDLIQPSFSFMVGVAVPFSTASRVARGQSKAFMTIHALWRAVVLVALGIFLRSIGHDHTYFTFEDTLSQIGLGYFALFLLGFRPTRDAWIALALILVGYWGAFALYPLPGANFDWKAAGTTADWAYNYQGFAAHWNKNTNLAWAFDTWFLNLFPPDGWFSHNGGGYATLSFIPTLGTMILGLVAGRVIRSQGPARQKVTWLLAAGAIGIAAGLILDATGVGPSVKRIWTPSWTLFSGGWCFLLLAGFYMAIDLAGRPAPRRLAFPLVVIGTNSIAAYLIAHLFENFIRGALRTHLGAATFGWFGEAYEPFVLGACILFIYWLILFWMYRRKVFLRI
jgi:heparan-alpha-glucosaminide N-acetyltransferase